MSDSINAIPRINKTLQKMVQISNLYDCNLTTFKFHYSHNREMLSLHSSVHTYLSFPAPHNTGPKIHCNKTTKHIRPSQYNSVYMLRRIWLFTHPMTGSI